MNYRKLGRSDLTVSEIALGSWLTYGGGVERAQAEACVRRAFDLGVNFIDTANVYAGGAAEAFLGEVLKDVPRSRYVLATKVYFPMPVGRPRPLRGPDREAARRSRCSACGWTTSTCTSATATTPRRRSRRPWRRSTRRCAPGKTRCIGFSEWNAGRRSAPPWRCPARASSPASRSTRCSGAGRRPRSSRSARPRASGRSSGRRWPRASSPESTSRASLPRPTRAPRASRWAASWRRFLDQEGLLERVQKLAPIARKLGLTMAQLALAWVLRRPEVTSAIVGASRPEQLEDNCKASGVTLSPEVLQRIETVLA